jgi:glutaconate CoA-transferase subunit B
VKLCLKVWRGEIMNALNYRICDLMVCELARTIHEGNVVFHGVASPMPFTAILLAGHVKEFTHLNLAGGVDSFKARPFRYSSVTGNLVEQGSSYFPLSDIFDLSMRGGLDVAFFSGIQFDVLGNINASVIGSYNNPVTRFPGGAGSAVLIPTVKRAVLWRTKHDRRTFVKKVDFVTARGNIDRIITPLAVFVYRGGKVLLESVHPHSSLEEVADNTGFDLEYAAFGGPAVTKTPSARELSLLKLIDPQDARSIEF